MVMVGNRSGLSGWSSGRVIPRIRSVKLTSGGAIRRGPVTPGRKPSDRVDDSSTLQRWLLRAIGDDPTELLVLSLSFQPSLYLVSCWS
jgi:hypothetical protein